MARIPKSLAAQIQSYVAGGRARGRTIAEVRNKFSEHHHGALSGQISQLHRQGRLERLVEKREGCSVYVDPRYVNGRETATQGRSGVHVEFAVANEKGTVVYLGPEITARQVYANSGAGLTLIARKVSEWEVVS